MNREQISRIAHAEHPIKAPLDDDTVRRLLERGVPCGDERVIDLGCGGGEWLLRGLSTWPKLQAEGVDISRDALAQAREAAGRLGVDERLVLHHQDAADFVSPQSFDLVLGVGAKHAFGGLLPTLAAARKHLAFGDRVLIGEGFWEREPSGEAIEMQRASSPGRAAVQPTRVSLLWASCSMIESAISARRAVWPGVK
ncbi:SAM-dependent methyltransferase [Streptomyces hygroscopicus subsp. limoneus]|nr:SAM-dependent methyltransferase [Streptomyces hygroscopicus subsp. limoneus]